MPRIFIINLLLLIIPACRAQHVSGDSLLRYEYAFFKVGDKQLKQKILVQKIAYYLKNQFTETEVFNEIKRVDLDAFGNNPRKINFLWNAAIIAYLNNETDYARFYLTEYEQLAKDSSVTSHLLSVLINKYADTSEVRKKIVHLALSDTLFKGLYCFSEIANYNRKHLNFYLISSAIIPGSGTIMNRAVLKGIVSLALAAGSVYGIVKMIEYGLYINAALWGTGVGLKFYAGNIKLTEQTFYKAEDRQKNKLTNDCELKLKEIILKYPLTLKDL